MKRGNDLMVFLASKIFILSIEQVMGRVRNTSMSVLLVLLYCICFESGSATDAITSSEPIKDPGYIISSGGAFKLGFFSPEKSTNRHIGIWYNNISGCTVVWVANRQKPLGDSNGVLTISVDGVLEVLNGEKEVIWSANVTNSVPNSRAQLLDSGNLVLQENTTGTTIWESFQYPSDTVLPTMKVSANVRTGKKVQITSWKSPSDPSIGIFSFGIQPPRLPQAFIWKDGSPYWRSGPWNSRIFIGIPDMDSVYLNGFNFVDGQDGNFYLTYAYEDKSLSYFALNSQGNLVLKYMSNGLKDVVWFALHTECDVYGKCGAFGTCDPKNTPICSCFQGFEPNNLEEWNQGNWTSGCVRRAQLQCERVNTGGEEGKKDEFLKLKMMKVPDIAVWSSATEKKCGEQCLENCSCIAYAYETGVGCMSWTDKVIDAQQFSSLGVDLYIRVAYSELDKVGDVKKIVTITMITGTIFLSICTYLLWRWMANLKGRKKKAKEILLFNRVEAQPKFHNDNLDQVKVQELPLFNFEELASATNNFHLSNELGKGGFGPVYK
ncbi:hypothetical protein RGQ29_019110 [Quercus rubra]|uniref:Uncharacterized protein n=1 Tax=Quercus rubra TaxID=3512 RepID=A0AAN7IN99_QUERU|nr:hypothetical protein RGQ29_019110 [Quercus rubra]